MARKPRIHIPGGLYHVILRGNGGQPIFFLDDDRYRFYLLLQEGTYRFGYRVHAFCLMPNHVHLALQAGGVPLSRGLQNISFRYTRWVNRREKRTGHLFQGRYQAVLVDGDQYLSELVRYIHLNPVRAGMVQDPADYPWSGHAVYIGRESLPWLTTKRVHALFGRTEKKARAGYQAFVHEGIGQGRQEAFYGGGEDSRFLGDEGFIGKCLTNSGNPPPPPRVTIGEIAQAVCFEYDIDEEILRSPSQQRILAEARAVVAWLARELSCATLTDVGTYVNRDVGTMSSAVRRLTDRVHDLPEVADRMRFLRDTLINGSN